MIGQKVGWRAIIGTAQMIAQIAIALRSAVRGPVHSWAAMLFPDSLILAKILVGLLDRAPAVLLGAWLYRPRSEGAKMQQEDKLPLEAVSCTCILESS